ncbi:hypothetical protein HYPSUDRAFT_127595 [Hypholoma sublateritium FD-334 SS-4]|uniref:Nuclease Le1 n=1 Tax=Hypholoma sublateritium (strain FD-334 SS-4) TaxID=945553 RepID=A0A0D2PLX6_HYPSF|nr:hypothetical protein HYPSUDRAFT_127595 [Hypholoma sublateritium FD-334 SS-4]
MKFATLASALALSVCSVHGWGENGHMTVGFVAMQFLSPKALSFVQTSLGSTYNESLGPAAPWADTVRSEAAFSWSAPFHFVDAEDNPPTSCSVVETRDCASNNCILTAIANYTSRVVSKTLSAEQTQEALKFIDHFIGDIGQPLHVEALEVGGNDITATCNKESTNLHAVNTGMIDTLLEANYGNSVTTWASTLVTRIKTGAYKSLAAGWISCSSPTETLSTKRSIEEDLADIHTRASSATITPLQCPLVWASEANAFDCSFVFSFTKGEDLCTSSYFTGAVPIIETQIAKQGYRLAAWLNVLFDGATNLP